MKQMIVKVQTPLFSTDANPLALVYNEDRTFEVYVPINGHVKKAMKGQPKAFFYAKYDKSSNVTHLGDKAPWQNW